MGVSKDDAVAALAAVVCPMCGNTSEVDYTIPTRERHNSTRAGIYAFYTERVYHDVLGDFRGRVVICDDPERYDAPGSRWMYDCIHCHHEWPMPKQTGLYEVVQTLTFEQRVARMAKSHRLLRLRPLEFRAADVVVTDVYRLLRVMADPQADPVGAVARVPFTVVGDAADLDRATASACNLAVDAHFDVYRPIGPPECVPADLVEEIVALAPVTAYRPRLRVKMVTLELREHFTAESVQRFMDGVLERSEYEWWVLDNPARGAARAIDL